MSKSIFSRLTLNFFLTLIVFALIIFTTLSILITEEPKRQFSEKLLRYMVSEIGTPPTSENLQKFSKNLGVSLTVTTENNHYWESEQGLPQPEMLEALTVPETTFDFLRIRGGDQVVLLRHKNYTYFISDFLQDFSTKAKITLLVAFLSLLLVLYINYRFIIWLFHPIKQLKSDVMKISEGDIDHHIKTVRNDELGELTQSVNLMTEKLRENISSKRELLLAISHELRTPLARAKMHLALLAEETVVSVAAKTDKENSDSKANSNIYQKKLNNNLDEINTLIEALLQSEVITEGLSKSKNILNIDEFNLSLLIQEIISEYDNHRIHFKLSNQTCLIKADALRIKLLISNILNNALKYSEGTININLDCDKNKIECSICDQGEGIKKAEIPKLTEAFYRPDKSRQRKTGSHGLGLYLCQKIVDAHGGSLKITSEMGKGTCVIINLKSISIHS